ncbi:MAG TPA: DUF262 domain-containing protein [Opitutaceae bacterium]|nr:DUF262 domain-containing protein [Opitutaceae bacterium]
MALQPTFGERTISELSLMFRDRQINLEPGFQRNSVWSPVDRQRLIQSIVQSYPVPSIFLYKQERRGRIVYDVIDGKQRLETIFMFTEQGRFKRERFETRLDFGEGLDWWSWKDIRRYVPATAAAIRGYKVPTVEVTGQLSEIIDLFVRINSTGKRLTSGEKRHAKFYTSPFLKAADHLVERNHGFFAENRVLSPAQLDRMKGTELVAELLMSLNQGGPINKKTALDRAIGNDGVNGNTLHRLTREFTTTLRRIRRMFPDLKHIRLRNSAEFYSLHLFVWEMEQAKLILTDRKRNRMAFELLRNLSNGVDALRVQLRQANTGKPAQRVFQEYLLTVQGDTDSAANRERRRQILRNTLWSIYERKDEKRTFTEEQRRLLWNSAEKHTCAKCNGALHWNDFTVDHVKAWARGGRSTLKNAQLMCRGCNSSKGAR